MIFNLIATTSSISSVPIPIMFPPHPKNLFFLPSPSFLSSSSQQIPRLVNRFPVRHLSCSSFPPTQPPWNCSSNVPVMVWWDFENCTVPYGVSWLKVAPSIMAAVRANGIKGQIQIGAFGDFESSKVDKDAIFVTGITGRHVIYSFGGNNNAYNKLLKELMFWVSHNPPPAHLFLILGDRDDRDLSGILHRLRMKNYNILIACSGRASDTLCSATTVMWEWTSMLKGEDVMGKQFNHPPNWPFNLFYGDLKMPLEKSFSTTQKSSQNANEVPYSSPFDNSLAEKKRRNGSVDAGDIQVSVWWNFNDCHVPPGVSVLKVPALIMAAVRANGIKGPIDIAAYGDITQYSKPEIIALSSAGVRFRDCKGGKVTTNKQLTRDLLSWTLKNPPPVHIFLISNDDRLLHRLRMKNYNMLVAHPGRASYVMCSTATIIWPWSLFLKGENLIGKYFNYPPDGPLNSCYGDLKVPDENSYIGESTSSQDA